MLDPQDNQVTRRQPSVTLIVPVRNEERFIAGCLDSVLANDYPQDRLEVLVIDGMSADQSVEIASSYVNRFSNLQLLTNPKRVQAAALNLGIKKARGDIIMRLDAHTVYESDYIRQCVHLLESTGANNVGGVQKAQGQTFVTKAIAIAMNSRFGVGDAKFRYANRAMWVDTVYLGAWRRETLEMLGGFQEWPVNEDYELNYRLRRSGGRILLSPLVRSRYYVRGSLWGLARQYFRYGFWKLRSLITHPDSLRWRQLVPPLFVLAVVGSLALAPFFWQFIVVVAGLYFTASLVASARLGVSHGMSNIVTLPLVFGVIHVCWGTGFLAGVFRWGPPRISLRTLVRALKSS